MAASPWKGPPSPPQFHPPYDSPIEDHFAWQAVKHLDPATKFDRQVELRTPWGLFRCDFLISRNGHRVMVECDGKAFHSDRHRDEIRDALIMGEGLVDVVWRLDGRAIYQEPDWLLFTMSLLDPEIFAERGLTNLKILEQQRADEREIWPAIRYTRRHGHQFKPLFGENRRWSVRAWSAQHPCFMKAYHDFAVSVGPIPLDEVKARWLSRYRPL